MKEIDYSNFVSIGDVIPDIILEVRYYSSFNFTGSRVRGYEENYLLLTKEAAESLKKASDYAISLGYRLKIYDAYRPQMAVDYFKEWFENDDNSMKEYFYNDIDKSLLFEKEYIALRSSHSRGSTVDLTLFDMKSGKDVDMGSPFDYFGEISHPDYKNISKEQFDNRMLLRDIMMKFDFVPIDSEWWHFTLRNEPYPNTYFNFPINKNCLDKLES